MLDATSGDRDRLHLHELDDTLQSALRTACAQQHVEIRRCSCSLRGALTQTADGFSYSAVAIHVLLHVPEPDIARAEALLKEACREVLARHPLAVPITLTSSVLP